MAKLTRSYNLEKINPRLSKKWHPTKNGELTPKDITPGSNKKVWWQCRKGHEWQAIVKSRVKGAKCPFCTGKLATAENNLQVINPKLCEEWHPVRNGNLTPKDTLPNSHKKVWWICRKGHEWQTEIATRANGCGCPHCSRKLASKDRNLKVSNPKLSK